MAAPCVGYGTYLFARMCSHGVAAIRAAPLSRWVKSDHQEWGFNVLACHARALLEGNLYFHYFMSPTNDALDEGRARVSLLQLNDCCSRLKLMGSDPKQKAWFEQQRDELIARLRSIPFYQQLPQQVQAQCEAGKKAWFLDRAQLVALVGMDKAGSMSCGTCGRSTPTSTPYLSCSWSRMDEEQAWNAIPTAFT